MTFVKTVLMKKIFKQIFKRTLARRTLRTAILSGTTLVVASCGQDRDLNEYRRTQVELELSKYRSIQGTYRGLAYQVGSKKPMGTIEVQLFANTVVDTDGLRREPRPVLQSYVTLRVPNLSEIVVSMDSGFYVSQDRKLKTSVNAERSETKRTIQLEGDISGSSVKGLLSVFGFPSTALEVDIERGAEWPTLATSEFAGDRLPYVSARGKISYAGKAHFDGGRSEKATLELRNNSVNSTGMLIDILSPVRIFTGIVDVLDSTSSDPNSPRKSRFTFSNMAWDSDAGTLVGSQSRGGAENITLRTECTEARSEKTQGWSCTYTSTLGGRLREFEFSRKRAQLQEPR